MPPSDPSVPGPFGPGPVGPASLGPSGATESWDPLDDEPTGATGRKATWTWHGRPSWGRRAVAAFPVVALAVAISLVAITTVQAQGAIDARPTVPGTDGATLTVDTPLPAGSGTSAVTGLPLHYQGVDFIRPSLSSAPIQGSTSLALPPYDGWEANGSAGADNGLVEASGGLLHVAVRRPTATYAGWFLTASSPTPDSCAFQFSAASPPPVDATAPGAVGELVMAVQTSDTVTTGDINYVVVAELVHPDGSRTLEAGYSLGHLSHATEHILKSTPWVAGPLQVSVETNGSSRLSVWVDGKSFLDATGLDMGIVPPLEPYLEVQARHTAYSVAYRAYSSVCGDDVVVSHLPDGTVATLDGHRVTVQHGRAVFAADRSSPPVTGRLTLSGPGVAGTEAFATRTYWPGDRLSYLPPTHRRQTE